MGLFPYRKRQRGIHRTAPVHGSGHTNSIRPAPSSQTMAAYHKIPLQGREKSQSIVNKRWESDATCDLNLGNMYMKGMILSQLSVVERS